MEMTDDKYISIEDADSLRRAVEALGWTFDLTNCEDVSWTMRKLAMDDGTARASAEACPPSARALVMGHPAETRAWLLAWQWHARGYSRVHSRSVLLVECSRGEEDGATAARTTFPNVWTDAQAQACMLLAETGVIAPDGTWCW